MNRLLIVLSVAVWIAAVGSTSAQAQCCGGGGRAAQHGCGTAVMAPQKGHAVQPADAETGKGGKLPADPVTGDSIDFAFKTVTADGPVYFSIEAAIDKFKEDPKAYAAKVNEQRAALAKLPRVQVNCPVMGGPIDGTTFVYTDGQGIYFCCPGCTAKYTTDPAKYKANLAASHTYQTRCPVEGETIDPTVFADLPTGQRVYFCSKADSEQFAKDPAKYAAQLAAQGTNINGLQPNASKDKAAKPEAAESAPEQQGHDHGAKGHG